MFGLESEKLSCMHEIEAYKLFMLTEFQKAKAVFRHGLIGSIWLSLLSNFRSNFPLEYVFSEY